MPAIHKSFTKADPRQYPVYWPSSRRSKCDIVVCVGLKGHAVVGAEFEFCGRKDFNQCRYHATSQRPPSHVGVSARDASAPMLRFWNQVCTHPCRKAAGRTIGLFTSPHLRRRPSTSHATSQSFSPEPFL